MSIYGLSQEKDVEIVVSVENDDSGKKLAGATVAIYSNGQLVKTSTSGNSGKVPTIYVPTGQYYQIFIQKSGFVTKMAELDARIDIIEDAPDPLYLKFETALFESIEGVDFAFLESTPMTKFDFDSEYYYRYDKEYTNKMLKKIEELKKQIAEKREEEEKKSKEEKKTEADFLAYVEAGDKAFKAKNYEVAVEQYGLALTLRADNSEVKEKRKEAQRLLDEQRKNEELEKAYQAKMTEALKEYKDENWQKALNLYTEASALKENEKEPKEKIDEIRLKIAELKAQEEKIASLVKLGDVALAAQSFDEAIKNYQEALGIKDDEAIKTKLDDAIRQKEELEKKLEEERKKNEQYAALLATADDLFSKEDLEDAKGKYEEALKLKPEESIPQRKIEEIDKLLADIKAEEELTVKYKQKMEEGQASFDQKDYDAALASYKEASELKPLQQDPKEKIKEIEDILEKERLAKEQYDKYVLEGDQFASTEAYEEAVEKYELARKINETDEITKKISDALEAMRAISEAKEKERQLNAEYAKLIEKADGERDSDDLDNAVSSYKAALELKSEESYPQEEIDKINAILEQRRLEAEAKKKAEEEYKAIIADADSKFDNESWEESKAKYQEAIALRSDDEYPKNRVKEIDAKLKEIADLEAKKKAYEAAMLAGQKAFDSKTYEEAIAKFEEAKGIDSEQTEPQKKIDEINQILADLKSAAEKEAAYAAAMEAANTLRDAKTYDKAKSEYQKALTFKENDETALSEIEKIDQILADQAKAAELEAQFNALVKAGDEAYGKKTYAEAKAKYTEAIALIASEEVDEKIKLCDDKLKEFEDLAAQKAKFDQLVEEADNLFNNEKWAESIEKYEEAKAIESNDHIVAQIKAANDKLAIAQKLKEDDKKALSMITKAKDFEANEAYLEALNTYQEAYALRPSPELEASIKSVETKIKEIEENDNLEKNYAAKLKEADLAFTQKKFKDAIGLYEAAKAIKSGDDYPDKQIQICNDEIAKLGEKELQNKYNNAITEADRYFSEKNYDLAITKYEVAKQILPSKDYPDQKIDEIRKIREDLAKAESDKLKAENEYKALVASGDDKLNSQNYEEAIKIYQDAQKIKSFDAYVSAQKKKAEEKLKEVNAAKASSQKYQSYIAKADELIKQEKWKLAIADYKNALLYEPNNPYPKAQIELAEKAIENNSKELSEEGYEALLKDAQAKFDAKDYNNALALYKSAFRQRPTDNVPADKIKEINDILTNLNAEQSSKNKYKELIAKADNLFEKKDWKKARVYYVEAYNLTNDSYPDEQIKKIDAINNKFSSDQYSKMIKKADEYFDAENYEKAKGLYNRAIKTFTSQNSTYPKAQIKKINAILNPPALLAGNQGKPVGEKVNLSEAEIQRMFQEAGQASKNKQEQNVLNSSKSAEHMKRNWEVNEVNSTYQVIDSINFQKDFVSDAIASAERNRQLVEKNQQDIEETIRNTALMEGEYSENVVFRQMQVVDNVNQSLGYNNRNNDIAREQYEPEVQRIRDQHLSEKIRQAKSHDNVIQTQVNQVESIKESQFNSFKNADAARLNTELDVSNTMVNIVNQSNKDRWNQEDQVFSTQNAKDQMESEQFRAKQYSDIPRQNMENTITSTDNDYLRARQQAEKAHANVTNSTRDAVVALRENMYEAGKNADLGRQNMEETKNSIESNVASAARDQNEQNQIHINLTEESIADFKNDQFEANQNKTNKLYEDTKVIEARQIEISRQNVTDAMVSENNMYAAVSKIDNAKQSMFDEKSASRAKATETADEILFNEEAMAKEKQALEKSNQEVLNRTEDRIIAIKDIDVKAVTQAVKNQLGNQYPEGVTEEVYQQKDEDGYLISYVIRRVVVKEGEGNVFEKTQMKHGISYTKNGKAITQFAWQDQTEDATLKYH